MTKGLIGFLSVMSALGLQLPMTKVRLFLISVISSSLRLLNKSDPPKKHKAIAGGSFSC